MLQDKELTSEEKDKTKKFIEESKKNKDNFKKEVTEEMKKSQSIMSAAPGMMPFMAPPMMFPGMPHPGAFTPEMASHFAAAAAAAGGFPGGIPYQMPPGFGFPQAGVAPNGNGAPSGTKTN